MNSRPYFEEAIFMNDQSKLSALIDALELRINALEKEVLTSRLKTENHHSFILELKENIKRFFFAVTLSLGALILWIAKAVLEKTGIGF